MKALIYAGIGLFSAATVYGIADYYNTQKKGTLDKLYKDQEEVIVPEKMEAAKKDATTTAVISEKKDATSETKVAVSKKIKRRKHKIDLDDFSRGRIDEPVNIVIPEKVEAVKEEVKIGKKED